MVPFLDSIFGFLYRKSDFYRVKPENNTESVVGFHPGQNVQLMMGCFNKWQKFAVDEREKEHKLAQAHVPEAVTEEVVWTGSSSYSASKKSSHKRVPDEDTINGSNMGNYKWSQTASEVELTVPVDMTIKKGNQVQIDCTKDSINVATKLKDGSCRTLVNGQFYGQVKPTELVWNLMPGSHILITLEKSKEGPMWSKCLKSESSEVNAENIDFTKKMSEMSDSDKMAVEYAVHQQKDGDADIESILRKAWNAEGSPFRGQPYDPTVLSNSKLVSRKVPASKNK